MEGRHKPEYNALWRNEAIILGACRFVRHSGVE